MTTHDPLLTTSQAAALCSPPLKRATLETYRARRTLVPLPAMESCGCCGMKGYRRSAILEWDARRARQGERKPRGEG